MKWYHVIFLFAFVLSSAFQTVSAADIVDAEDVGVPKERTSLYFHPVLTAIGFGAGGFGMFVSLEKDVKPGAGGIGKLGFLSMDDDVTSFSMFMSNFAYRRYSGSRNSGIFVEPGLVFQYATSNTNDPWSSSDASASAIVFGPLFSVGAASRGGAFDAYIDIGVGFGIGSATGEVDGGTVSGSGTGLLMDLNIAVGPGF